MLKVEASKRCGLAAALDIGNDCVDVANHTCGTVRASLRDDLGSNLF